MSHKDSVFINVPFDRRYKKLFDALVFAVHDSGMVARCSRERDDGSQARLDNLFQIISDCRYGIHDLSRTTLDTTNRLPRFNMPLELGIFLGSKRFGGPQHARKSCLILDREPYRYQIFCSDIAGQDIKAHGNEVRKAIAAVRNWLRVARPSVGIPGASTMAVRYVWFRQQLPAMCRATGQDSRELSFLDYRTLVTEWLKQHP